jgi:hypothetical protein
MKSRRRGENEMLDRVIRQLKKSIKKMDRILNKPIPKKSVVKKVNRFEKLWADELENDKKWEALARRNGIDLRTGR